MIKQHRKKSTLHLLYDGYLKERKKIKTGHTYSYEIFRKKLKLGYSIDQLLYMKRGDKSIPYIKVMNYESYRKLEYWKNYLKNEYKMVSTTNEDKVNHFLNNLKGVIHSGYPEYDELWYKVRKIQNKKIFKNFCIQKFDEGERSIDTLKLFFEIQIDEPLQIQGYVD